MSDIQDPQNPGSQEPLPPYVIPVRYAVPPGTGGGRPPYPPPSPPRGGVVSSMVGTILAIVLFMSVGMNLLFMMYFRLEKESADTANTHVVEQFHSGKSGATAKIAIIHVDGVIMEGANAFVRRQIEQAAEDANVKAIVLRINSPGGTITGSDDLHRRLIELRDGSYPQQKGGKKPIIVSMGSLAASGGYYIAMPAEYLVAEETTITGSIGVYAAFPNVSGLAKEYGFGMNVIKAGEIKDSGSMFHDMTPQERQLWQDMVDNAFDRFLTVCAAGRPKLSKAKLREVVLEKEIPDRDAKGNPKLEGDGKEKMVKYVRRRADGGIWTSKQAKEFGLVDEIGYIETAIKKAAEKATELGTLSGDYKVVNYEKLPTLSSLLLGVEANQKNPAPNAGQIAEGTIPRLWFLTPQSELSGILAAVGSK